MCGANWKKSSPAKMLRSPKVGPIDPLFASHAATYRSVIVNGLNRNRLQE